MITSSLIVLVGIVFVALAVIGSMVFTVHTNEAVIIERFGKYLRTAHAGLNFKIPVIDTIAARIPLSTQQLDVSVETKTQDNVFVTIPVAVQYTVPADQAHDAHYKLNDPHRQMFSFIQDNIRSTMATMTLDKAFESKDDIARNVEDTLKDKMSEYGYHIDNTLVTDISPDAKVREAMNAMNAEQRNAVATRTRAEATKAANILAAEGGAAAATLRGQGIASERLAIANGISDQYAILKQAGLDNKDAETILLTSQYLDAQTAIAASGNTKVMFVPSDPSGITNIASQFRNANITGNEASRSE